MLNIEGTPARFCDGVTRRDFLRVGSLGVGGLGVGGLGVGSLGVGSLGVGGLALDGLLGARASNAATNFKGGLGRAKSCILLFMGGGPPQMDTFDLKPDAPAEVRGEFPPIATSVPGTRISALLPQPGEAGPPLRDHPQRERRVHGRRPRPERLPRADRPSRTLARQRRRHPARGRRLSRAWVRRRPGCAAPRNAAAAARLAARHAPPDVRRRGRRLPRQAARPVPHPPGPEPSRLPRPGPHAAARGAARPARRPARPARTDSTVRATACSAAARWTPTRSTGLRLDPGARADRTGLRPERGAGHGARSLRPAQVRPGRAAGPPAGRAGRAAGHRLLERRRGVPGGWDLHYREPSAQPPLAAPRPRLLRPARRPVGSAACSTKRWSSGWASSAGRR